MSDLVATLKIILWTLGVISAVTALVLLFVAFRHRKIGGEAKLALYLALTSTVLLSVAVALIAGSLRSALLTLSVGSLALGALGLLSGRDYAWLRRFTRYSLVFILIGTVGVAWGAATLGHGPAYGIQRPSGLTEQAHVTRVVDGDTIVVAMEGRRYRVRYIGMDTPETVHPTKPVECFGREASAFNKKLVEGRTVWLERDISQRDPFGRLLRYVWLGDDMVNAILVAEGYAQVATFPPDVKYQDRFLELQRDAREHERGLWARC